MKELSFQIFFFATFVLLGAAAEGDFHLTRIPENATHVPSINSVFRMRPCGGPGKVLDLRVSNCSHYQICRLPHNTTFSSQFDFIPSASIAQLGVRVKVLKPSGAEIIADSPVPKTAVKAGQGYTLFAKNRPKMELLGTKLKYQYILFRVDDGEVEVCSEAVFRVV